MTGSTHLRSGSTVVIDLDHDGRITGLNDAAVSLLGQKAEYLIGEDALTHLVSPRHREMFETIFAASETGRLAAAEARMDIAVKRGDGRELLLDVSLARAVRGATDEGVTLTCRDITDRREAERLLTLQDDVADALSSGLSRDQMFQRLIEAVGTALSWPAGAYWQAAEGGGLRMRAYWRSGAVAGSELESLGATGDEVGGTGVVAECLSRAEPVWLGKLASAARSSREVAAARAGMRSVGAVPVRDGRQVLGVLEFFSPLDVAPGPARWSQLEAVGLRLGRHLSRSLAPSGLARYKLDVRNSHLEFSCAFMKFMTVHGVFRDFSGWMEMNGDDPETVRGEGTVKTASVDTRSIDRDEHLCSRDFFAVERHPNMLYRTIRVEPLGDEHFRILGELTIRDVTRPIRLEVRLEAVETDDSGVVRMTISGGTLIRRTDWFLDWEKALTAGRWIVGNEVRLDLVFTLVRQADRAAGRTR